MSGSWQEFLYPLGLLSTVAFTLRFLVQWWASEKARASIVTASFWWLSLGGNIALGVHSFIQAQFLIYIVQLLNAVISMRNLNLMESKESHWSFKNTVAALVLTPILGIIFFSLASYEDWMRIPTHPFQKSPLSISALWHVLGGLGVLLFASRFWVQWLQSEFQDTSTLGKPFWWISLLGALFSLAYFARIQDYINLVGPLFGMIPYVRNLLLMRRVHA